jgi:antirestriction protein ArdC
MSNTTERQSLYGEETARIIAELEAGRLPWVQPCDGARCPCTMPYNAVSGRRYSGVNILILWGSGIDHGYGSQRWLTYWQDEKAIFRAASASSKTAEFLLSHGEGQP